MEDPRSSGALADGRSLEASPRRQGRPSRRLPVRARIPCWMVRPASATIERERFSRIATRSRLVDRADHVDRPCGSLRPLAPEDRRRNRLALAPQATPPAGPARRHLPELPRCSLLSRSGPMVLSLLSPWVSASVIPLAVSRGAMIFPGMRHVSHPSSRTTFSPLCRSIFPSPAALGSV
jgi:hypothetical protein